jgi:hypothetical protein
MFFPRIRRHAKWVFVFLALAFGLGFVGFGVGAGGVGIGDILKGSGGGSGVPSISSSQKKIEKNPTDAQAYRDLATAYQAKGDVDNAVDALGQYTNLRPKDVDALRELAGLYLNQASAAQQRAQIAELRAEGRDVGIASGVYNMGLDIGAIVGPAVGGFLGDVFGLAAMFQLVAAASLVAYFAVALTTPQGRAALAIGGARPARARS